MSESRSYSFDSGESRGYSWGRESYTSSSESRDSSESRGYDSNIDSFSYESRDEGESRSYSSNTGKKKTSKKSQYNSLEDIDILIERLEGSFPKVESSNPRINKALEVRREQIKILKELSEQSKKKIEEDKLIEELESQNEDINDAINGIKQLLKSTTPAKKKRNQGESRW